MAIIVERLDLRIGRFDRAPRATEQVEFPRRIEAEPVGARLADTGRPVERPRRTDRIGVPACCHGRAEAARDLVAFGARLQQPLARDREILVVRDRLRDQRIELRVTERVPPVL